MRPPRSELMSAEDQGIIHRLSSRDSFRFKYVIDVTETFQFKFPRFQHDRLSSLGTLERLPVEVLNECMMHMDLLSLLRLCRVSARGAQLVASFLPLKHFMAIVGNFPLVLAKAKILDLHSFATLNDPLNSEQCVSCGADGPLLHLLLAQRCCLKCQQDNQSLWNISLPKAQKCFGLSNHHLKILPVMWIIPGSYGSAGIRGRSRPTRITSVRAAKELARRIYGTFDAFEEAHPLKDDREVAIMKWYRRAPLEPLGKDRLMPFDLGPRPDDPYPGMATVDFPSFLKGPIEHEHSCLVCIEAARKFSNNELDQEIIARIVPLGWEPGDYFSGALFRRWLTRSFVEHAKQCHPTEVEHCGQDAT